jgi:hypothetical protein
VEGKVTTNLMPFGYVAGGSLQEGLFVEAFSDADPQEGEFVVVTGRQRQYYGVLTDIGLEATDPRFPREVNNDVIDPELRRLLHGASLTTRLNILPVLMLDTGPDMASPAYPEWAAAVDQGQINPGPRPIKSMPRHGDLVRPASAGDIAEVFGDPAEAGQFVVGYTREQDHPVALDLRKLVKRSAGVFGATGSGKSFLTRMLLAGLIQQRIASMLVFDMHNEYGYDDTASDTGERVIGLKTKFSAQVQVVGLGGGALIRGNAPDFNLELAYGDIQPADILLLARALDLRDTTPVTLEALVSSFGPRNWLAEFCNLRSGAMDENEEGKRVPARDSVAYWAQEAGVNVMAAESLHSKLRRLFNREYLVAEPAHDTVSEIVKALEAGRSVVLSFGRYDSDLDYLLVTNLLARRIRQRWETLTDDFRVRNAAEPQPLVIVLEEAHKLLNGEMASQTTFSAIARELRKYYVTLLVVDQRPSQIYDEVMSQLGTRMTGWLGDEDDIAAVLSGLAGRSALRGMLARLQPKEEVMLMGWGVPIPLPVRSRRYDEQFWAELQGRKDRKTEAERKRELGF